MDSAVEERRRGECLVFKQHKIMPAIDWENSPIRSRVGQMLVLLWIA